MSNYIEYNGKIAFHPGYYIREIIEESGLTQEDNLIPPQQYQEFLDKKQYDIQSIKRFESGINRDPGIVLGIEFFEA